MRHWMRVVFFYFWWAQAFAAYSNDDMKSMVKNLGKGYIRLTDSNYKKHLYGHRDYSVILFMTSQLPQLNCILCRQYTPTFETVAYLYEKTFPNGISTGENLYFLYADFTQGRKLFEELQLDLIPKLYYFHPTPATISASKFDSTSSQFTFYLGDSLEMTIEWIQQLSQHKIKIYTPTDYGRLAFNAIITFVISFAIKRFRFKIFGLLLSNFMWGFGTVILVLLFISGQMFNQIRLTPFVEERKGGPELIARNSQSQYGVETQIVSTFYGLLGVAFLLLANRVSAIKNDKVQVLAVAIVSALLYVLYSMLISIFNIKYNTYPFMLLEIPLFV